MKIQNLFLRFIVGFVLTITAVSGTCLAATPFESIRAAICPDAQKDASVENYTVKDGILHLVPCYLAAYQASSIAVIEHSGNFWLLSVPVLQGKKWVSETEIMNASFDPKTQKLYTYSKARGGGDCGSAAEYRLEDLQLVLTQAWFKPCDDNGDGEPFEPAPRWRIYPK